MTYAIYDGNALIADRLVMLTIGDHVLGRKQLCADGYPLAKESASPVESCFNDCKKIMRLKKGTFNGKPLKCIVAAGVMTHIHNLLVYLEGGYDLMHWVTVESAMASEDRLFFTGGNQLIAITEDNVGHKFTSVRDGIKIDNNHPMQIGSGSTWVDSYTSVLPVQTKPLTSLEAHTYASNVDHYVSMRFDYYMPKTDTLVYDQLLSTKQRAAILKKLQGRIDISHIPHEQKYANQ